jgi:hypothetical protein
MKCRLCGQEAELCNSHIIPEFFYGPMYEDNRIYAVPRYSQNSPKSKIRILQKGSKEKLLCQGCENKFSKYENYTRQLFFKERSWVVEVNLKDFTLLTEIDYRKFKMFQLSVLWRASISSLPEFKHFTLGPHELKIRSMLLNDDPGKYTDYGCIMMAISINNKPLDILSSPEEMKIKGQRCYRFLFGGYSWMFFCTSHVDRFEYKHFFLSKEGKLPIFKTQAKDSEFLIEKLDNLKMWEDDFTYLASKHLRNHSDGVS